MSPLLRLGQSCLSKSCRREKNPRAYPSGSKLHAGECQNCNSLYEIHRLNKLIEYEFTHYPYPVEIEAAINETIEACTTQFIELVGYGNHHLVAS